MNVRLDVNGRELFAVSFEGLSLWPDEEFLKVPGDIGPVDGTPNQKPGVLHEGAGVIFGIGQLVFEIGEDGVRVCAIDVALLKNGEVRQKTAAWTHMLQGTQDLAV